MLRALIVDDDPISLRFLEAALKQLGCSPAGADTAAAALAVAAANAFDLLLLDRNLPDGSGAKLLVELRRRGVSCPAVATSAEMTTELQMQLREAGFAACIEKPVSLAALQALLRPWLEDASLTLLDDEPALAAVGGDRHALQLLRGMLAQELSALHEEVSGERIATQPLLERLHRLRASCGFCGTPQLAAAAIALERVMRENPEASAAQREDFLERCRETITALRG